MPAMIDNDGGGAGFDIEIYASLFEANSLAKKEFLNKFIPAYTTLQGIFDEMKATESFKGTAKEGFMETFEILLRFHKDLNEAMPSIFASIEGLNGQLINFESSSIFTNLDR